MALSFGVALDFGSRLRPPREQLERQAALLPLAEQAGFELVAAGESASAGAFHLPNALQVLAAIAPRTRLQLCAGIALLPAWDAWKLALDAAQLDQLSGGRFRLGVGLGTAARQAQAGWPARAIGDYVDDYLAALRALWSEKADYQGSQLGIRGGLPIQPTSSGGPPIWVGGTIRRSALRAARFGDGWYGGVNFRLSALPTMVGRYRAALEAQGKPPANGAVVLNRVALAAESQSVLGDLVEQYVASTLRGYAAGGSLEDVIDDIALVGTPDQVLARAERYAAAGATHLVARLSLDEMPLEVAQRTIELFGRQVIPRLR